MAVYKVTMKSMHIIIYLIHINFAIFIYFFLIQKPFHLDIESQLPFHVDFKINTDFLQGHFYYSLQLCFRFVVISLRGIGYFEIVVCEFLPRVVFVSLSHVSFLFFLGTGNSNCSLRVVYVCLLYMRRTRSFYHSLSVALCVKFM